MAKEKPMKCRCCDREWPSVPSGLCKDCIELRRALRGLLNRGFTVGQVLASAGKLLQDDAKEEAQKVIGGA